MFGGFLYLFLTLDLLNLFLSFYRFYFRLDFIDYILEKSDFGTILACCAKLLEKLKLPKISSLCAIKCNILNDRYIYHNMICLN